MRWSPRFRDAGGWLRPTQRQPRDGQHHRTRRRGIHADDHPTRGDEISGGVGDDVLEGETGDERLFGGMSAYPLNGGVRTDYLNGHTDTGACVDGEVIAECEQ